MNIKDYEKMILDGTSYSGNKTSKKKQISASSLMDDILPMYLKYKHGLSPQKKIQQNTIGSLLQHGIDHVAKESEGKIISALRLNHDLENGWSISGEIDQLFVDKDKKEIIIVDNKVTKMSKISDIRKKGRNHQYAIQLATYKMLIEKETNLLEKEFKGYRIRMFLFCFLKDGTDHKKDRIPDYKILEIDDYYDAHSITEMAIEQTNKIQTYIDSEKDPEQCNDLFWSRSFSPARPMRCVKYCSVSEHCPYLNETKTIKSVITKEELDKLR